MRAAGKRGGQRQEEIQRADPDSGAAGRCPDLLLVDVSSVWENPFPPPPLLTYSFPSLQVLIYTEDFKSERADRERAQGQIDDLKEQVYQLKRQLHKQVRGRTLYEAAVFLLLFFFCFVF